MGFEVDKIICRQFGSGCGKTRPGQLDTCQNPDFLQIPVFQPSREVVKQFVLKFIVNTSFLLHIFQTPPADTPWSSSGSVSYAANLHFKFPLIQPWWLGSLERPIIILVIYEWWFESRLGHVFIQYRNGPAIYVTELMCKNRTTSVPKSVLCLVSG